MAKTVATVMQNKSKKASFNSKAVQMSQKRNEWESVILKSGIKELERRRVTERALQLNEKEQLRKDLVKIKNVRKTAPISPERKMFLSKHGVTLQEKEYNIDDFITLIDDITCPQQKRINPRTSSRLGKRSDSDSDKKRSAIPLRLDFSGENNRSNDNEVKKTDNEEPKDNSKPSGKESESVAIESRGVDNDGTTDKNLLNRLSFSTIKSNKQIRAFRNITPPEKGRLMWSKSKLSESASKSRDAHANNDTEGEEDIRLREEADDYRYRLLIRHNMGTKYIHSKRHGTKLLK